MAIIWYENKEPMFDNLEEFQGYIIAKAKQREKNSSKIEWVELLNKTLENAKNITDRWLFTNVTKEEVDNLKQYAKEYEYLLKKITDAPYSTSENTEIIDEYIKSVENNS